MSAEESVLRLGLMRRPPRVVVGANSSSGVPVTITYTGGLSSNNSLAAFVPGFVTFLSNREIHIRFGPTTTGSASVTSDWPLRAGIPEEWFIDAEDQIFSIATSSGGSGTLWYWRSGR